MYIPNPEPAGETFPNVGMNARAVQTCRIRKVCGRLIHKEMNLRGKLAIVGVSIVIFCVPTSDWLD